MSSFPQHRENILALQSLGFDVSESLENGDVSLESWGYDELTETLSNVIQGVRRREAKLSAANERIRELSAMLSAAPKPEELK